MNAEQTEHLIEQGRNLLDQGDLSGAGEFFSKVLELDSDHAEACLLLGSVFGETGHLEEAVALVRKSTELDPGNSSAHLTLGHIYHSIGQTNLAIRAFEAAVNCDGSDPDAQLMLATALLEAGTDDAHQRAVSHIQRVIESAPNYLQAWVMDAWMHQQAGDTAAETSALHQILRLEPGERNATVRLTTILVDSDELSEAEGLVGTGIEAHPEAADLVTILSNILMRKGELALARQQAEKVLAMEPDNPEHILQLAEVLSRHGNNDAAFNLLKPFLEAESPTFRAVIIFANISTAMGMVDDCNFLLDRVADYQLTPSQEQVLENTRKWLKKVS